MLSVVVGLGNPGPRYEGTRHNIGWDVVTLAASRRGAYWRTEGRWKTDIAETNFATVEGPRLRGWLVRPLTYMNLSGEAVRAVLHWHKLGPDALLVVTDDVSLPLGRMRLRPFGGHGGHNGLRSIIETLGSDRFARLRCGVGSTEPGRDLANYVLGKFEEREQPLLNLVLDRAAQAVDCACTLGLDAAMNQFNRADPEGPGEDPDSES
jgi:PTH1 family peptidyl-tRNA hydrolase